MMLDVQSRTRYTGFVLFFCQWWLKVGGFKPFMQTMIVKGEAQIPQLNGFYRPMTVEDWPGKCYQHEGDEDLFLCQDMKTGEWVITMREKLAKHEKYARSVTKNVDAPQDAGPWETVHTSSNTFKISSMTVAPRTEPIIATMSTMTFGSAAIIAGVAFLALGREPGLRDLIYGMVSVMFTIFIANFLVVAFWAFLFEFSGSLRLQEKVALQIIIGFFLFSSVYFSLLVAAWKFQYSYWRVALVRTLGAAVVAFLGIMTATNVMVEAVKFMPVEMKDTGFTEHQAGVVGAFLVTIGFASLMGLFREASKGFRISHFAHPPVFPWSTKRGIMATTAPRNCVNFFPGVASSTSSPEMDYYSTWEDQLEWGEDTVAILVESFLLNQSIFFVSTGKIVALSAGYYRSDNSGFWVAILAVCMVSVYGVSRMRSRSGDKSRLGRAVQYSVAMSCSWCLYRLLNFMVFKYIPDNVPLAAVTAAFLVTAVSVCALMMLSTCGVNMSADATWEKFTSIVTLSFGNMCGLAWGTVFTKSIDSLADVWGSEVQYAKGFEFCLSLVLAGIAGFAWWRVILPRAEAGRSGHSQLIDREAAYLYE